MSFELKHARAFDALPTEYKELIGFTFGVGPYHQERSSARAPLRDVNIGDRKFRLSGSGSWIDGLVGTVKGFGGRSLIFTVHDDLETDIIEPLVSDVEAYNEAVKAYNMELGVTTSEDSYSTGTRDSKVHGLPTAFLLAYTNVMSGGAAMKSVNNVLHRGEMLNSLSVKANLKGGASPAENPIFTSIPQGSSGMIRSPGGIYVHVQDLSLPGQGSGVKIIKHLNQAREKGSIQDLDYVLPWSTLAVVEDAGNMAHTGLTDLEHLLIVPSDKAIFKPRESYGFPLLMDLFKGLRGEMWIANARAYKGNVAIPEDNASRAPRRGK